MSDNTDRAVAIVGVSAIMPDAPDADTFWRNITGGRYSISEVPPERWDPALYYDPNPAVPDKSYSKIGGWVREFEWNPLAWRLPVPPRVSDAMDDGQKWAVSLARSALRDYGWPERPLDGERTAVVIGTAIGGEKHYQTSLRIYFPEFARELEASASFAALPKEVRAAVLDEAHTGLRARIPAITEDTMPGELPNIIAGRIANVFDLRGPSYTTDAACASGLAAMASSVEGLITHQYDAVVTGGIDRNMGANSYVKFCKIGALSATGTRPYAGGADGFVMGEGGTVFVLKRLADAERDGDRIYAVLLGIAGASDGRGKGITAPNPVGQRLAVSRAWRLAGVAPSTCSLVEGHGTSTAVGDVVEVEALASVFGADGTAPESIPLGSVKSNIGHLKGAAGTAGLFKAAMSLHHKVLPATLHAEQPNPNIDFARSPFRLNTETREWDVPAAGIRRAGVSAFGFGGTNFHAVLEEYVPGRHRTVPATFAGVAVPQRSTVATAGGSGPVVSAQAPHAAPPTGDVTRQEAPEPDWAMLGGHATATTPGAVRPTTAAPAGAVHPVATAPAGAVASAAASASAAAASAAASAASASAAAAVAHAAAAGRADTKAGYIGPAGAEVARTATVGTRSIGSKGESIPPTQVRAAGIGGRGAFVAGAADAAGLVRRLREAAPLDGPPARADLDAPVRVAIDFGDADELAGKAERAIQALTRGEPALLRALRAQGVFFGGGPRAKVAFLYPGQGSQYIGMLDTLRHTEPVVAETFAEADRVMTPLLGRPLTDYMFATAPDAEQRLLQTEITQPAVLAVDIALTRLLATYGLQPDLVMGHSLGEYGALVAAGALSFGDALGAVSARGNEMAHLSVGDNGAMAAVLAPLPEIERIVAATTGYVVIANVNSMGQAVIGGATTAVGSAVAAFAEAGHTAIPLPVSHAFHTQIVAPASEPLGRVLRGLDLRAPRLPVVANVDGQLYPTGRDEMIDILKRQIASPVQFVTGLRTLYVEGARVFVEVGPKKALHGFVESVLGQEHDEVVALFTNHPKQGDVVSFNQALCGLYAAGHGAPATTGTRYEELGHLLADFLERSHSVWAGAEPTQEPSPPPAANTEPVVITGAALGLPGTERVFDDENVARILAGQQFITPIPQEFREAMADRHITRLVKSEDGAHRFDAIDRAADVIKLAARAGKLDLVTEFGVDAERDKALDGCTRLAIGAGLDALRDAGIPLVRRYRTTTVGTKLATTWGLPDALRDDTGVIFASAFPGYTEFATDLEHYLLDRFRRQELAALRAIEPESRRIAELEAELAADPFEFDRRFIFRVLAMGHSQFAELIGARGPNTQVNAACASTTQAVTLAEDWIRAGRCRRVVIVAADDVTSDTLLPWVGAGFLASGAAATDEAVEDAAIPFDNRRHGMLLGMGAASMVVESAEAARERGLRPICEVLAGVTANSAFHGTRLDVDHVSAVMADLVDRAERRGVHRDEIAAETVFVSHETYTPARGGSAQAEIDALRSVFGPAADRLVIANTKGLTGHPMGVGIEDVVAVKALETGLVPPVPNFKEVDPGLGALRLSTGGAYPVRYALRLAAGFGSQISMVLLRWTPVSDGRHRAPHELGYEYRIVDQPTWQRWLTAVTGSDDVRLEVVQRRLRVAETVAPATKPVAPETSPPTTDDVADQVLAVVAEKTGYPADVLELDLDLEADLGIDTVKQAEVFAQIREHFTIPRDDKLKLRDYPTLAHVIGFVREHTAAPEPVTAMADDVAAQVLAVVAEKTGYPADVLELDLDLEADLGIDTVKQAEVFAQIRERFAIPRDDKLKLRDYPTLAHVIGFVRERTEKPPTGDVTEPVAEKPATDDVSAQVLAVVAEKTGYPEDVLDLDLDLEADLGIDTVKQAEVFAQIRERFAIPRDDKLKLRDYPTLAHVIGFVRERAATPAQKTVPRVEVVELPETDGFPRRVPVATIRPPFELCLPTGVELGAGTRVVVAGDRGGVADALTERLRALDVEVLALDTGDDVDARLGEWLAAGPVHGVYWLPALDHEGPVGDMDLATWREANRIRVKLLYTTMRTLYDAAGFLVTATRLGGRHGYDENGAHAPLGGAVTGFAKAFARERTEALVKAVDVGPTATPEEIAGWLVDETRYDPGTVEVGHADGLRWTVTIEEREAAGDGLTLGEDTVFVVTGAAGSIVSAITADLAAASGGTFHLLDLTPEPDPGDADVARFATDREGLKADLIKRLRKGSKRPTPVRVEKELARFERLAAAQSAIDAVRRAGGQVHYHSVDLTDGDAVARALAGLDRVDVLVHAAGLDLSHTLPGKKPREYDLVFDVKADGWFNLVTAIPEIGTSVAFCSVAGRFGNLGQTDYAAANDLLCKLASANGTIAIDWTAWAGIGMATRGSIPTFMAQAGVEMLPPAIGVPAVRRELTAGSRGEVVVAGRLGMMVEERAGAEPATFPVAGPMVGRVTGFGVHSGLVVETTIDPAAQAFLHDHRIDGTPVLPGVMGIEAFTDVAALPLPGWQPVEVCGVEFLAPCKFYRDEPRTVTITATYRRDGDDLVARCRLDASRQLPNQPEPQVTTHFTGEVRLRKTSVADAVAEAAPAANGKGVTAEDIYGVYFHGPAFQVLDRAWRGEHDVVGLYADDLPTDHVPADRPEVSCPRLIELVFQTAGVWEIGHDNRFGLPRHVDRIVLHDTLGGPHARVAARVTSGDGGFGAQVVDENGVVLLELSGYRTVELPGGVDPDRGAPLTAAMTGPGR